MSDNLLIELAAVLASERKSIPVSNLADRWLLDEKYQSAQAERRSTERKFNPDQPRIPGGHEGGGRWGSFGAGLKLHSLDDLIRIYGDWADEVGAVEFEDGSSQFAIVRFDGGDMALLLNNAGPNREYAILTDGGADDMRELADRLEWAATGGDHNAGAPDPDNHLVDWDWVNDSILVGYDESGDVRIGFPSDEDPDELVEFDLSGEDAGEAWEVIDALRDMADAQDAAVETVDGQRSEHRSVLPSSVPTKPGKRARRRMPRKVPRSLYRKKKQPAAMRKFDPNQPRDPHSGEWSLGGAIVGAIKDMLKLAGKIDLDDDEHLLGSGKVDADFGGFRIAAIDRNGVRAYRIGFGTEGFGRASRDDNIRAWDGNPTPHLSSGEHAQLTADVERLDSQIEDAYGNSKLEADLEAKRDAIQERLNAAGEFNQTAEIDEYTLDRLATKVNAAMAEATDLDNALRADPDNPDLITPTTFVDGVLPGSKWGDIHYQVYLDEPSYVYDQYGGGGGPTVYIGVLPKDDPEWQSGRDWAGSFLSDEWRKILKLMQTMRGGAK